MTTLTIYAWTDETPSGKNRFRFGDTEAPNLIPGTKAILGKVDISGPVDAEGFAETVKAKGFTSKAAKKAISGYVDLIPTEAALIPTETTPKAAKAGRKASR